MRNPQTLRRQSRVSQPTCARLICDQIASKRRPRLATLDFRIPDPVFDRGLRENIRGRCSKTRRNGDCRENAVIQISGFPEFFGRNHKFARRPGISRLVGRSPLNLGRRLATLDYHISDTAMTATPSKTADDNGDKRGLAKVPTPPTDFHRIPQVGWPGIRRFVIRSPTKPRPRLADPGSPISDPVFGRNRPRNGRRRRKTWRR